LSGMGRVGLWSPLLRTVRNDAANDGDRMGFTKKLTRRRGRKIGYCARSGCGSRPSWSNTIPRSRQSIQAPQASHLMKCSASSFGGSTASPIYLPRGMSGGTNRRFFRSKRPVNRALGICYGIRSGLSAAGDHHTRDRYGPFPHLPCDPLNNRIFDAAIFHAGPSAFVLSPVSRDPL